MKEKLCWTLVPLNKTELAALKKRATAEGKTLGDLCREIITR